MRDIGTILDTKYDITIGCMVMDSYTDYMDSYMALVIDLSPYMPIKPPYRKKHLDTFAVRRPNWHI